MGGRWRERKAKVGTRGGMGEKVEGGKELGAIGGRVGMGKGWGNLYSKWFPMVCRRTLVTGNTVVIKLTQLSAELLSHS